MVEKKIRSLFDGELKTAFAFHYLSKDEVKVIHFKDEPAFKEILKLGLIIEAERDEKEVKPIPIILPETPEVTEDEIVEVNPELREMVEKLLTDEPPEKLEPPETDETKPDLPYPKEGLPMDREEEDESFGTTPRTFEEADVEAESLDDIEEHVRIEEACDETKADPDVVNEVEVEEFNEQSDNLSEPEAETN